MEITIDATMEVKPGSDYYELMNAFDIDGLDGLEPEQAVTRLLLRDPFDVEEDERVVVRHVHAAETTSLSQQPLADAARGLYDDLTFTGDWDGAADWLEHIYGRLASAMHAACGGERTFRVVVQADGPTDVDSARELLLRDGATAQWPGTVTVTTI